MIVNFKWLLLRLSAEPTQELTTQDATPESELNTALQKRAELLAGAV